MAADLTTGSWRQRWPQFTPAFTRGRCLPAGATPIVAGAEAGSAAVLLVCWFDVTTLATVRGQVRAGRLDQRGLWLIWRACTSCKVTTDATGTRLLLGYRLARISEPCPAG